MKKVLLLGGASFTNCGMLPCMSASCCLAMTIIIIDMLMPVTWNSYTHQRGLRVVGTHRPRHFGLCHNWLNMGRPQQIRFSSGDYDLVDPFFILFDRDCGIIDTVLPGLFPARGCRTCCTPLFSVVLVALQQQLAPNFCCKLKHHVTWQFLWNMSELWANPIHEVWNTKDFYLRRRM